MKPFTVSSTTALGFTQKNSTKIGQAYNELPPIPCNAKIKIIFSFFLIIWFKQTTMILNFQNLSAFAREIAVRN